MDAGQSRADGPRRGDPRELPTLEARYRLGNNIRARRRLLGLTQAALAQRSHLSPVEVSRAERGLRDMRVSTLVRFAEALGRDPADLMRDVR